MGVVRRDRPRPSAAVRVGPSRGQPADRVVAVRTHSRGDILVSPDEAEELAGELVRAAKIARMQILRQAAEVAAELEARKGVA